ncbi:alpha/beta fold hydrolase [Mycolicibacterium sp. XJ879]
MWWEQVAGLASDFTVYTLDMLGQPGASIQSKTMFAPADCARSIDEVLEGLRLRAVHLVGHSYGGWLATHTAARAPGRLATVTLVDPASTVARTSATFWRSLALIMSRPRSVRAGRAAAWIAGHPTPGSSIDTLARLFTAGFAAFAPPVRTPALRFPSDRLLRSVSIPVQVLLAGNTVHDSEREFDGCSPWCRRGDITSGPPRPTPCQPRSLTRSMRVSVSSRSNTVKVLSRDNYLLISRGGTAPKR